MMIIMDKVEVEAHLAPQTPLSIVVMITMISMIIGLQHDHDDHHGRSRGPLGTSDST